MRIKKPIYEALPYLYIFLGVMIALQLDYALTYVSAALFYTAGAAVWVMRSAWRRKEKAPEIKNRAELWHFPTMVYEYLPFIYMAFGVVLVEGLDSPLRLVPGFLFFCTGMVVWAMRMITRHSDVSLSR